MSDRDATDARPRPRRAAARWDPAQYLRFGGERLRPGLELLARVPLDAPRTVYDLGCGTGDLTRIVAARWPGATVIGVDHSPEMLERARGGERGHGGDVRWVEADIATWQPEGAPDVIYSNATLQWLDDHAELFPRLASYLAPGGALAVQMPLNWSAPSHRLMRETLAGGGPGGAPIGPATLRQALARRWVEDAGVYFDLLAGPEHAVDIWETEYLHVLEGDNPVLEWVKGTGLRPVLAGLDATERDVFLATYRRRLREAYPRRPDGRTLFPFRRLFVVAVVPARG